MPENIHSYPRKFIGNSKERGLQKSKFTAKLEFPGGGSSNRKNFCGWGIWIFSGKPQIWSMLICTENEQCVEKVT